MALPTNDPGTVQPRWRRFASIAGLILKDDVDTAAFDGDDFVVAVVKGVPTAALPTGITRGLALRTDGSATATLYLTVNAGTTWTAVAVP